MLNKIEESLCYLIMESFNYEEIGLDFLYPSVKYLSFHKFPDRLLEQWETKYKSKSKLKKKKENFISKLKRKFRINSNHLETKYMNVWRMIPECCNIVGIIKKYHCPSIGLHIRYQ